ncbi:MAG: hypothetical protein EA353_04305, partial [Puniceicoccaceae bacterium]
MKSPLVIFLLLFGSVAVSMHAAIIIEGFTSATNDRFANDEQFIANSFDLSGVGLSNNSNARWLTMVSENVFLSSNHFFPSDGTNVTFHASNDPNGLTAARSVLSSQRVGSSDIRIGTLNAALGSAFTFYNFATQNTTNNNTAPGGGPNSANSESFINSPYYLADAYLFGKSPTEGFVNSQNMAV